MEVMVTYKDGRTTGFPDAEVKYDSACGTYAIHKEDGGTIYVPSSHIEKINIRKEDKA